jgi:hypothetical protein
VSETHRAGPLWRVGYHAAPLDFTPSELYEFSHRFDDVERRFPPAVPANLPRTSGIALD